MRKINLAKNICVSIQHFQQIFPWALTTVFSIVSVHALSLPNKLQSRSKQFKF